MKKDDGRLPEGKTVDPGIYPTEGSGAMNVIIPHTETIVQVKVPLPFPLRWVNSYLIRGKDGFTVIDPGLHTPEAEELWRRTCREQGIAFTDIAQIVLTHFHPDHYGIAGWMQQRSGAPVRISRAGFEFAMAMWGEEQPLTADVLAQFARHGMDDETLAQMKPHLDSFKPLVSPPPEVSFLEPGGTVRLGDDSYVAILAEGHAEGHLCFYDERRRVLFCGDQVLTRITPNVSLLPGSDANPLATFLRSLEELSGLAVGMAYPGHREPFAEFAERARELIDHHRERLAFMRDHLRQPMTAYELCRRVFGDRLTIHQLRFAMAETLAHVVYLREQGRVAESEQEYAAGTGSGRASGGERGPVLVYRAV